MGRLVLHIGMHKTGTSSIQRFFSRNRRVLRWLGIHYPDAFTPDGKRLSKHNNFFTAMSHEKDFETPHDFYGPSEGLVEALAEQVANHRVTVISAEGLSGEFDIFAERFAALKGRCDIRVIVFLRRQDAWIRSFHAQMSRMGDARSLHAFLQDRDVQRHLDYGDLLKRWQRVLGREAIHVRIFPNDKRLLTEFLEAADLPRMLALLPHAHAHVNRSEPQPDIDLPEGFMDRFEAGNEWIRQTCRPDLITLFD